MKSEYVTLLTVIASIVSGWGGAFIAGYFSRKSSMDTIDRERNIEKKKERIKEKRDLIKLYTYLIKLDYGKEVVTLNPAGFFEIDDNLYESHIRNSIYDKYHLIHDTVIEKFNTIEEINKKINFDEFYTDRNMIFIDGDIAAKTYFEMIKEIKRILDKERVGRDKRIVNE